MGRCLARICFGILALVGLLGGCRNRSLVTPQPVTLRVAGSTSFGETLAELGRAYQERHPEVMVDVLNSDSQAGLQALKAEDTELAAISWLPSQTTVPAGLVAAPVARDAVAIIVHPNNPVQALTLLQLRSLYAGEAIDWGAFGGPVTEPVLISREDGSGTRGAFEAIVMGEEQTSLNALIMPSTQSVIDYVASHPAAVGYVSAGAAEAAGKRVRALAIENATPVRNAVQSGNYHLSRLIYLVRSDRSGGEGQQFIDFVLSPAGQAIIAKHHVPVR